MLYQNKSQLTGKLHSMELDCTEVQFEEGVRSYQNGELLQNAFHFLSADEREFVKTGITPEEWNNLFGG